MTMNDGGIEGNEEGDHTRRANIPRPHMHFISHAYIHTILVCLLRS